MTDGMAETIVQRVLGVFPKARKVLLFGSRATGSAAPDSDYDLLVVARTDLSPARRGAAVRLALRGIDASFDVLVVTPEEYDRLVRWKSSVVYRAATEGKVLHDAA
jgi:predicted nucleotidyltransferase